ncbi:MAG: hypothetical protein V1904_01095 [Bacteroidota bacterium]
MNIQSERLNIIEQINKIDDVFLLRSIKSLLDFAKSREKVIDLDIPVIQQSLVKERVKKYENNETEILSWNDLEQKIGKKK